MATLALRNKHDQAVGSLAVQLLGSTSPADIATVGGVSHDLEPKLPASIPPPARNVVKEFSDDILESLKQIVVKAKIVADLVGETAEVRVAPFRDVSRPCNVSPIVSPLPKHCLAGHGIGISGIHFIFV